MQLTQLRCRVQQGRYEIDEMLVAEALMIRCLDARMLYGEEPVSRPDARNRARSETHQGSSDPERRL